MAARLAVHVRFPLIPGDELEDTVLRAPEMGSPDCQALVSGFAGRCSERCVQAILCSIFKHF